MIRILATDGMESSAAEKLREMGCEVNLEFFQPEALAEQVREADVLVVRSATKVRVPVLDAAAASGRLRLIIRGGVGIDNIDAEYARSKGIEVRNTPNASSASVAELTIAHLFSMVRFIQPAGQTMREGRWEKKQYEGIELAGKTLGLIGLGRIGKLVAEKASALGMRVVYTNRTGPKPENDGFFFMPMDQLLAESDFISLHLPKCEGPILSRREFEMMKEGVYLVNTARGGHIPEADLLEALDSGKLAWAALDVFSEEPPKNKEIFSHPKISLTPHIGASTKEAQKRIGDEIVGHIVEVFSHLMIA